MKYNPRQEIFVQQVIKALADCTEEEIAERMTKPPFDKVPDAIRDIDSKLLHRIVMRWEKRKVITSHVYDGKRLYCLRQIPWLSRLDMIHVESVPDAEAKKFLAELERQAKEISAYARRGPIYGDYVEVEATFETIDPILGGDLTDEERVLAFPRNYKDELYIRPNWIYGYIRDNARIVNLVKLQYYLTASEGVFVAQPTTFKTKQIRVKEGHVIYEGIPPGSQFKTRLQLPLKGYDGFNSIDAWKGFFNKLERAPIRGMGSNWKIYGGRIRLVSIEEMPSRSIYRQPRTASDET